MKKQTQIGEAVTQAQTEPPLGQRKLALNSETIRQLSSEELRGVAGGFPSGGCQTRRQC